MRSTASGMRVGIRAVCIQAWKPYLQALLAALMTLSASAGDWWAPGLGWGDGESEPFVIDTRLVVAGPDGAGSFATSSAFHLNTLIRNATGGGESNFVFNTRGGIGMGGGDASGVFAFDTRTARATALVLTGATTVPGGGAATYAATLTDAAGLMTDVTDGCLWSFVGTPPAGAMLVGSTLRTAPVAAAQTVTLRATHAHPLGQLAATLAVTVAPDGMQAAIKRAVATPTPTGVGAWSVSADAMGYGRYGDVTARWTLDGQTLVGATSPQLRGYEVGGSSGMRRLAVELTDTQAQVATAAVDLPFNLTPVGSEPRFQRPVSDPVGAVMRSHLGAPFEFQTAAIPNGLAIITHGVWSDGTEDWVRDLANHAEIRLSVDGRPRPNIAILDWRDGADPEHLEETTAFWSDNLFAILFGYKLVVPSYLLAGAAEIYAVRQAGLNQGVHLADWIRREIAVGHIAPQAPLHLIGHSAGGFLMGECAFQLKEQGLYAGQVQVTTLDTPYAFKDDAKPILMSLSSPAESPYERYYASPGGIGHIDGGLKGLTEAPGYFPWKLSKWTWAHSWVHEWYDLNTTTSWGPRELNGFYYSPFMGNGFHNLDYTRIPLGFGFAYTPFEATQSPLAGFDTFGDVVFNGGVYRVTEGANAGIFREVDWPEGAQSVTFRYRFAEAGDGDYLVVYGGTSGIPLLVGSDLQLSRDRALLGEVPVAMYAGATNLLTFMLVSRGQPNAVLELSEIMLAVSNDPDGDGLTTEEEHALGTNPLLADTDGDGLTDYDELNTHFTDPTNLDTDGDGVADGVEIRAGTDPRDADSVFTIAAVERAPDGRVSVSWRGVQGRRYRVHRATDLLGVTFETIAGGISGVAPITTIEDATGDSTMFYWIEVEDD